MFLPGPGGTGLGALPFFTPASGRRARHVESVSPRSRPIECAARVEVGEPGEAPRRPVGDWAQTKAGRAPWPAHHPRDPPHRERWRRDRRESPRNRRRRRPRVRLLDEKRTPPAGREPRGRRRASEKPPRPRSEKAQTGKGCAGEAPGRSRRRTPTPPPTPERQTRPRCKEGTPQRPETTARARRGCGACLDR